MRYISKEYTWENKFSIAYFKKRKKNNLVNKIENIKMYTNLLHLFNEKRRNKSLLINQITFLVLIKIEKKREFLLILKKIEIK